MKLWIVPFQMGGRRRDTGRVGYNGNRKDWHRSTSSSSSSSSSSSQSSWSWCSQDGYFHCHRDDRPHLYFHSQHCHHHHISIIIVMLMLSGWTLWKTFKPRAMLRISRRGKELRTRDCESFYFLVFFYLKIRDCVSFFSCFFLLEVQGLWAFYFLFYSKIRECESFSISPPIQIKLTRFP